MSAMAERRAVLSNLSHARAAGCRFADFTGGEPLLHPDLALFLKQARSLGLITSVTTNGILFPDRASELEGLINLFHISLDGGSAAVHDKIRGAPCFHKVIQSLEMCRTLKLKPDILFTFTRENHEELGSVLKIAEEFGRVLIVNPVFNYGCVHEDIAPLLKNLRGFLNKKYVYINRAFLRLHDLGGNRCVSPRCRAVGSTLVISPEDRLLLPCFHFAVHSIPIDGQLEEILKRPDYLEKRKMQGRYNFCQGCTISCYMDPSFHYKKDYYTLLSLRSKWKYVRDKYLCF